ncbi:hypothetical protein [Aquimarina sp. AU119]|uniref:hypothetical protein n=1 Tax=Aquimarina sp. AU119 TaxID=2108528 RepID=UPI000D690F53|nr:hypothetical protein [Aquimarina sp. AU119]
METVINQIVKVLKADSVIELDRDTQTIFIEGESDSIYILLETTSFYGEWDLQLYIDDEIVIDTEVITTIKNYIHKTYESDIQFTSSAFTYQDQQHANSLIFA